MPRQQCSVNLVIKSVMYVFLRRRKKTDFNLKMQGSCVFLGENINIYATSLSQKVYYSLLQEIILESDDCLRY